MPLAGAKIFRVSGPPVNSIRVRLLNAITKERQMQKRFGVQIELSLTSKGEKILIFGLSY
jgi:hypothetical protein